MIDRVDANNTFEWKENISLYEWDRILSAANGHPLQSARWGDARALSDGITDYRWVAYKDGSPVFLARFEVRRFLKMIKIAWSPKGPLVINKEYEAAVRKDFLQRLKTKGYFLHAANPWDKIDNQDPRGSYFYTIWVDLTLGKDKLWANLHKQFRYDVRRASKLGVSIERSKSANDVNLFYELLKNLSQYKVFNLCTSDSLMSKLLEGNEQEGVESYLFIARHEGEFCGAAFIIRCGESVHYMWGAVDRKYAHLSVGEAIQWDVIEWALSRGCTKYDLEGISPAQNSGVDYFKKKIGGSVVAYPDILIYPLYGATSLTAYLTKLYLNWQPKLKEYKKYFVSAY